MRYNILLGELAHPLTRPDALRLARSFASRSTLACRGRIYVRTGLALSVHFSRSSMEGIVGVAGTIPAGFSAAAFINHVVYTLTYNVDAHMRVLCKITHVYYSRHYSYSFICLLFSKINYSGIIGTGLVACITVMLALPPSLMQLQRACITADGSSTGTLV